MNDNSHTDPSNRVSKDEGEWRAELTPDQYEVLRNKGTEPAFAGRYVHEKRDGTKFDSGTGWPSFTEPADRANVELHDDDSYGMHRTEVTCAACGGHLGHVFDDGPGDTGERFCINSVSLELDAAE
jgi:peptide-methionine (R)-S-oxide reductase